MLCFRIQSFVNNHFTLVLEYFHRLLTTPRYLSMTFKTQNKPSIQNEINNNRTSNPEEGLFTGVDYTYQNQTWHDTTILSMQ